MHKKNIWNRICFTAISCFVFMSGYAQERQPIVHTININGNTIELLDFSDTFEQFDPITNEVKEVIENPDWEVAKVNGSNIYTMADAVDKKPLIDEHTVRRYILNKLLNQVVTLGGGLYLIALDNIILNEKGKVAYYYFSGIEKRYVLSDGGLVWKKMDTQIQDKISGAIKDVVAAMPAYAPVTMYKNAVVFKLKTAKANEVILVKNGIATIQQ